LAKQTNKQIKIKYKKNKTMTKVEIEAEIEKFQKVLAKTTDDAQKKALQAGIDKLQAKLAALPAEKKSEVKPIAKKGKKEVEHKNKKAKKTKDVYVDSETGKNVDEMCCEELKKKHAARVKMAKENANKKTSPILKRI
jgi:hypothetical protein